MLKVDLSSVISKLSACGREGIEKSIVLSIEQASPEVSVLDFLRGLGAVPLSDLRFVLSNYHIDIGDFCAALTADSYVANGIEQTTPSFSPLLVELLQDAWLLASSELGLSSLRSGVILLTLLHNVDRYLGPASGKLIKTISLEDLKLNLDKITKASAESPTDVTENTQRSSFHSSSSGRGLEQYTVSLTEKARTGQLDPVFGRDFEIEQMLDILCCRRKNNPIVIGDAGVGKTAIVEGIALRICEGEVPEALLNTEILSLDLAALQAGASVKGEFEKRVKSLIEECKEQSRPVLLFIDEAHMLIGAGNAEGGGDAANLLKPALARGELRTIAATTWREYKKYFEKDPALTRRFQPVKVAEPDLPKALTIVRGLRDVYEQAHGVLIGETGLRAAVELSSRYLAGRQLPDKAIDVLDTACARLGKSLQSPPRKLIHLKSLLMANQREVEQIEREQRLGRKGSAKDLQVFREKQQDLERELQALQVAWDDQRACVGRILGLHRQLLEQGGEPADTDLTVLANEEETLRSLQGTCPLVWPSVEFAQIAETIADWTGIPIDQMTGDELSRLLSLPEVLSTHVQGQETAIARIHRHLLTARADLRKLGRPLGAFLLVGPSGVGKTETVVQVAEHLYGGAQFLTTVNMSEYQEKHTVSRLIGSPPGYVGYGEGGILTEAIRQSPYSVVLLDEVEKAHPDVLSLFYQAFDKGELADGEGRVIDCSNVVFFLTSNLGDDVIVEHSSNPDFPLEERLYPVLTSFFRPALLARMEVIPYKPLALDVLQSITEAKLESLASRLLARHPGAEVIVSPALVDEITSRATRSENGARMLESIIDGDVLPPVAQSLLTKMFERKPVTRVEMGVDFHTRKFIAEVS